MDEQNKLIKALDTILKLIVPDSDSVTISPSTDDNGVTTLEIAAPETITGQIIGKEGKIIKSIRILLSVAFPDLRFNIQIKD